MEYYFHTNLGLLALVPHPALPTAVDLLIAGKVWASYPSVETAANTVAGRVTGHTLLDNVPLEYLPAKLSNWKQTTPHYFTTGSLPPEPLGEKMSYSQSVRRPKPETFLNV